MIENFLKHLFGNEGGYVNDPNDPGGETKFGISKKSYPNVDIKNLTIAQAAEIYKKDYWNPKYGELRNIQLAFKLFDLGVNMGVKTVIKILQHTLRFYFNCNYVIEDGIFGHMTLQECNNLKQDDLYKQFIKAVEHHYDMLCINSPKLLKFRKGWQNRLDKTYLEA